MGLSSAAHVRRIPRGAAVSDITITLPPSSVEVRQAVLGENGVVELTSAGIDGDRSQRHRSGLRARAGRTIAGNAGHVHRRDDSRQRRAGRSDSTRPVLDRHRRRESQDRAAAGFLNEVAQNGYLFAEPWMPKAFKIAIILYATANNIITAEICSWLTAQGADLKLFLKLLQTTGSQASAIRMEEFMKRKNNHGGAPQQQLQRFPPSFKHRRKVGDSDATCVDGQSDPRNGAGERLRAAQ